MGIIVAWGDADQLSLLITFNKPWNWTEFQAAADSMLVLANSISHKTNLILDIRNAGFPPDGALRRFRNVSEIDHPNIDRVIYVAPRMMAQFVRSINSLLSNAFFGHRAPEFDFAPTLEEAQARVQQKPQRPAV